MAEVVFTLLHTPGAIRHWWSATRAVVVPERGGIWAAARGHEQDDPDYVTAAAISKFEPPRRLVLSDYRSAPTGATIHQRGRQRPPGAFASLLEERTACRPQAATVA
ncbi:MAG: SRPBCC domain-containing protein [Acidobacteriota bacterium]|nr:SRPBCC domain-containing protein [Acidobacteriota bacterium]